MNLPQLPDLDPVAVGRRLQQARERQKLRQEEAAALIGVSRTTMVAIEKGERRIRAHELLKLAAHYNTSVSDLVHDRPTGEAFNVQFRSLQYDLDPTSDTISGAIDEFRNLCHDFVELERITGERLGKFYPEQYDMSNLPLPKSAELLAEKERQRLGLGTGPIFDLRSILETQVGIRIFLIKFASSNARVSEIYHCDEELGACMAINIGHPQPRRNWSMAHAYAHFLVHRFKASVSSEDRYRRKPESERLADAFASAFLMPATGLMDEVRKRMEMDAEGKFTIASIFFLADYYQVSPEALCRRLEDLGILRSGFWDSLRDRKLRPNDVKATLGIADVENGRSKFPQFYIQLALSAFSKELIGEEQFAKYMRTDLLSARRIRMSLAGSDEYSTGE